MLDWGTKTVEHSIQACLAFISLQGTWLEFGKNRARRPNLLDIIFFVPVVTYFFDIERTNGDSIYGIYTSIYVLYTAIDYLLQTARKEISQLLANNIFRCNPLPKTPHRHAKKKAAKIYATRILVYILCVRGSRGGRISSSVQPDLGAAHPWKKVRDTQTISRWAFLGTPCARVRFLGWRGASGSDWSVEVDEMRVFRGLVSSRRGHVLFVCYRANNRLIMISKYGLVE